MGKNGKRNLLYRIFFRTSATRTPVRDEDSDQRTVLASQALRKSVTLRIRNEGEETVREMTVFPFMIGREYYEDGIQLDNKSVSRRHAAIAMQDHMVTITDEHSSNGVEVSGKRIIPDEPYALKCGDDIKVGSVVISVLDICDPAEFIYDADATERGEYTQLLFPWQAPSAPKVPERQPGSGRVPESVITPEPERVQESTPALVYDPPPVKAPAPVYTPPPVKAPAPVYPPPPAKAPAPAHAQPPVKAPAPVYTPSPVKAPAPVYTPPPVKAPAPEYAPPPGPHSALVVYCIHCGYPNSAKDSNYCIKCGSRLIKSDT